MRSARRAATALREVLLTCASRRNWYRVEGSSMAPTLEPDDCVFLKRTTAKLPEPGTLVVVSDPERRGATLIKRVRSHGDDTFSVMSDNPSEGRDSRHFGSLSPTALLGQVTLVISSSGRVWIPKSAPRTSLPVRKKEFSPA